MSSDQIIPRLLSGKASKTEANELNYILKKRNVQIKYKLTTQNLTTHNGFQWTKGIVEYADGSGALCSSGYLHYYHNPLLAAFLNPIHANISNPKLWIVKCEGQHLDDTGLKGGCTKMTLLKDIKMIEPTLNNRIAFGILCAMEVYKDETFQKWAQAWIDGTDRTEESANAAAANAAYATAYAADAATYAANAAARDAATYAARAAADAAANAAANAANAAYATANANAAYAAYAAYAARDAANAARVCKLDLITLAEKAMTIN